MAGKGYYISVDGGGSKTEFCVYDIETGHKRLFLAGSTNFKNPECNAEETIIDKGFNKI